MVKQRTNRATEERVFSEVGWLLRTPSNRLYSFTDFREDLHLDQLDLLLLIVELEHRFQVYLTGEEVASIRTMGDLAFHFGRAVRA